MDEQRIQAYLSLIQELLTCPGGEERRILGQHSDLIDEGFFRVGAQVAQQLQEAGQEQKAQFLMGLLAQLMDSEAQIGSETGVLGSSATPQKYEQFLGEVLQAVSDSQSDPAIVYPLLANNLTKLNTTFIETIQTFVQNNSTQNTVINLFDFGHLIQKFPLGQRALNLEIAIAIYNIALDFFPQTTSATAWAAIQNSLGLVYGERITGDRADNIEKAISAYEAALQVYTREAFLNQWATVQNNSGLAYSSRIIGDRADNIEKAIAAYEAALQVRTYEAFPEQWAMTQNNLGAAYGDRIRGNRAENLEKAISAHEAALQVYTQAAFPQDWAMTQNNLGIAYRSRITGDRAENLERAIAAYQEALQVYTREAFPE
ncbi:MAG: tetratricopeptide repeat protein, partial [Jaaginema sp. PMC 1079.18]|nr:tetratricopeptide repeat protein [Jaaginema sp. PMC 1079.18]